MRIWLGLGLALVLGLAVGMSGCRKHKYTTHEPSLEDRSYNRHRYKEKPVPPPAPQPVRTLEPAPNTRSAGWSAVPYSGEAYAAIPAAARVPAVTSSDWNAQHHSAPAMVAAAPAAMPGFVSLPDAHPARRVAPAMAAAELSSASTAAVPAALRDMPALPRMTDAQRTLAAMPTPGSAPVTDPQYLAARSMMGMAAPAGSDGGVPPRAEVVYASAGAVPAALRGLPTRQAAPAMDWTAVELPPTDARGAILLPIVASGAVGGPVAMVTARR